MKTFLPDKWRRVLIRRAINMLPLSIIAIGFLISPSEHLFAKKAVIEQKPTQQGSAQPKMLSQVFKDFCVVYYHDGTDKEEDQDTQVCQDRSSAFASLMLDESPEGSKQWGIRVSLDDLAKQKQLLTKDKTPIQTQQDFAKSITDPDLQALIGGGGDDQKNIPQDSDFLPNVWNFKLVANSQPTSSMKPIGTHPPVFALAPAAVNINVTCRIIRVALACKVL